MIIPPGYAHVTQVHAASLTTRQAVCTFGVKLDGADFGENRVQTLWDIWNDRVMDELTDGTRHVGTLLKYGPTATGPVFQVTGSYLGQYAAPVSPPNVAHLIEKRTALGGRKNRGRMFIPGLAESNVDAGGNLAPSYVTALNTVMAGLLSDLAAADMPMVILHSASSDPTIVSTLQVDPVAATQRRRLRR